MNMERTRKNWKGTAIVVAAVGILLGGIVGAQAADIYTDNPVVKLSKEASPAVVNVDTETMVQSSPLPFADDPFFKEFFGDDFKKFSKIVPMRGKGSGFIITKDGYILTNNHVVENADKITVTLSDGKEMPAKLIGRDPTFDVAVVKVEPSSDLATLTLGDSDKLEVGEWVAAIGNPFGLEHTVTVGVVSAKDRSIHAGDVNFEGFLQTDAAINPGNSGGPLLNMKGEVVGINTAIIPFAQGIGFAIPINMAKQVTDDLMTFGKVRRGWLGVYLQPITPEIAETYSLKDTKGALVGDVVQGSPAAEAGIKRGDIILSVDDKAIEKPQDLVSQIRGRMAGDSVSLALLRKGNPSTVRILLGDLPGQVQAKAPLPGIEEKLGLAVEPISPKTRKELNLSDLDGMLVSQIAPGSPADRLGLRQNDLILEVNGKPVSDGESWRRAVNRIGKAAVFLVYREGRTFFASMRLQ